MFLALMFQYMYKCVWFLELIWLRTLFFHVTKWVYSISGKCLYLSGLIPEPLTAYDDHRLLKYGIGFTNIVNRTSRGSADLTRKEIKDGGEVLKEKIMKWKPKITVFNGKGIYEIFCGHKNFHIGKQPEPFPGTVTVSLLLYKHFCGDLRYML